MIKNRRLKLPSFFTPLFLTSCFLISSCAQTAKQKVSTINSSVKAAPASTPTQELNRYAHQSQKRELDQVIMEEVVEEKPEFLLDVQNKKVDFWINYFAIREKARFERFLNNGAKYRELIEKVFDDYGLPKELFYVGLIESGYYLGAKSHAGAVGPWQFIRDTGRRYGLTIRSGIDERRSIAKSTQAAALYFQDLYNIFGNWELALSAYNAGEYGIVRRIRKAKTRDYYELSAKRVLPKETIHYVPKVLAAMKIMQNPKKYNIRPPKVKADLYANTKEVTLKNSVKIDYLAKKTGVSKSQILALNPDIYWRTIPYVRNGFKIYLPNKDYKVIESINSSARRVAQNSSSSSSYKVRKGDNLISIARRYNVGLNELKRANRIRRSNHIRVGQRLKIPGLAQAAQTYRVKSGDNLISIAKRFNVSLTQLKGINRIKRSNHIRIGQNLKIPGASEQLVVYKVKRGDNLYELARRNHTSISKILKLNNLRKRTIYVGQKLSLPKRTKNFYTVRPGDYLLKIAKKHGISVKELKTLNSINRSKIYPGQKLVVDIN